MQKYALLIALLVYTVFSLFTLFFWQSYEHISITGDEPHYLVMANGIIKYRSLEQTTPYKEEFKKREICKNGLAPQDAKPTRRNTHAVPGPNGLFNVHNIGLPLLLAIPCRLGGVMGAKLVTVFFGALIIVVAWKFSSHFSTNNLHRFWAVVAALISLPLIPRFYTTLS